MPEHPIPEHLTRIHGSTMLFDLARIEEAAQANDGRGFCLNCGEGRFGCEPDARNYVCGLCEQRRVFGAEELLTLIY